MTPIYGYEDDFSVRYYRDYRLGLKAYVTADTPVYCVPENPVYGEIEQSEVMVQPVKSCTVLRINAYYPVNVYTTNVANEFADVVAIKYRYNVIPSNAYDKTFVMVDEILDSVNQNGDNIHGHSVTVNKTEKDYLEIIKTQAEQLSKSQEQIDRLLSIIERMK